jgi:hypothetical protein
MPPPPRTYTTFEYGTKSNPVVQFDPFHVTVYTPLACSSQCGEFATIGFPVLLFATGFAAQLDADSYSDFLIGVCRQGIVVVVVDQTVGLKLTQDYTKLGPKLGSVVNYIADNTATGLLADLRARGVTKDIYMPNNKIFFGGHSSGVHIALEYINQQGLQFKHCNNVAGVAMISPLDGQDPVGFGGGFIIKEHVHAILPFVTPTVMVSAELDDVAGSAVAGASCVPDNRGYDHFYDAWNTAKIYSIRCLGVGHLDILNQAVTTTYDPFCAKSNSTDGSIGAAYRLTAKGSVVSFIQGVVKSDTQFLDKLSSASSLHQKNPILKNKGSVRAFGCSWSPVSEGTPYEVQLGLTLFAILFSTVFISGLFCFFRKMDEETLGRYVAATEPIGYDHPPSYQQPIGGNSQAFTVGPSVSQQFGLDTQSMGGGSRAPSIQV